MHGGILNHCQLVPCTEYIRIEVLFHASSDHPPPSPPFSTQRISIDFREASSIRKPESFPLILMAMIPTVPSRISPSPQLRDFGMSLASGISKLTTTCHTTFYHKSKCFHLVMSPATTRSCAALIMPVNGNCWFPFPLSILLAWAKCEESAV